MRRLLSISFVALALLVGAAGVAPAAHAQDIPIPDDAGAVPNLAGTVLDPTGSITAANMAADAAAASIKTDYKPDTTDSVYNTIMVKIMSLFAWLVGVAALTLNYAVFYTVVKMGDFVNHLSAIGVTWRILRDIGNIMLIFGFLAVGITTILNVDWYGGGKKMIPMMLVAAVFLNFSLFISEAVIDAGNLFATQFYTQIVGGTLPTQSASGLLTTASGTTLTTANEGISNKIMGQLGLQTIYGNGTVDTKIFEAGNPWIIGFFGILLFIVTAFVLFSLAFVLIARFVALIFLIILAPVGFAGLAVPQLKARAGKWWGALFQQTITAPILLLMLYIALTVITDVQFLTGFGMTTNGTGAATGFVDNLNLPGFAGFVLSFLVAMGLLLAVVIQSKNLAAFGAAGATKLAGSLTFGATAFGLRSTAGWGSQGAAQAIRRSRFGATKIGRVAATTFDKGAKASFDIRGATIGGGLKALQIDAGEAQKGGYKKRREDAIKGHQEYVKSVVEAIDEKGISKEDEDKITRAEEAKARTEEAHERAQEEHEAAKKQLKPQIDQHQAEVVRLTKEQNDNIARGGLPDPETQRKLDAARQVLAKSVASLKVVSEKEVAANEALQAAIKEETKVSKEANRGITAEKKKAQLTYAGNISGSFPGWVMYGPGGSAAARKIVKDAKKSPDKQLLDQLKKAIAAGDKEEKAAATEPEKPKPATP